MPNNYIKMYGAALARRDGGWRCHYCGMVLRPVKTPYGNCIVNHLPQATVDHVKPIKAGGARFDLANMVLACQWCNTGKDSTVDEPFNRAHMPRVKLTAAGVLASLYRGKKTRARKLKRNRKRHE